MPAATIIFTDIVSFSGKSTDVQKKLVLGMSDALRDCLEDLSIEIGDNVIPLSTGDGIAVAILDGGNFDFNKEKLLTLIASFQNWAQDQTTDANDVALRIGVHMGKVEIIKDIADKTNICGHTINQTQRVMDAANPRQTLFSEEVFRNYVGVENPKYNGPPFTEETKVIFDGPFEVLTKHEERFIVYSLILEPEQPGWNNAPPVTKDIMFVRLTELPKEIVGSFSDRILSAHDCAFIQLTGERFLDSYDLGEIRFGTDFRSLSVYMPDPEVYGEMKLDDGRDAADLVKECIERWKVLFGVLSKEYGHATLKLGMFEQIPYLGASFLDWKEPEGKIHVSAYIWGAEAKDCPGYDIKWIGQNQPSIYEAYVRGLDYLDRNTINILE